MGSDRTESPLIEDLRSQGIEVFLEQDGSHVPEDADLFVYSEAIPEDAPERQKAKEYGIEQQSYFKALGELSREYQVIAVCGTHGKSSTTAMAARVLIDAGLDPSIVVGTKIHELQGRNWRKGGSNLFLLEACEYRRSFHYLAPDIALLTNCDGDHFDAFPTVEEYQQAFVDFLKLLPEEGTIFTHLSDPDNQKVTEACGRETTDVDGLPLPSLAVPGRHMQENAQLVLALAQHLGISDETALASLKQYAGSWRRMEVKGTYGEGVTVIDDYAHHPREIRPTIAALKEAYAGRRLVCAFQPHTHDRTLRLYDDFVASFSDADLVIIPNIYVARSDIETDKVDLEKFLSDITEKSGVEAIDGQSLEQTEKLLREKILQPNDVLLCMVAGDITSLAEKMTRGRLVMNEQSKQ